MKKISIAIAALTVVLASGCKQNSSTESASLPAQQAQTLLQAPEKKLSVEAVSIVPPGDQRVIVQDVNLTLDAGQGLGIIGPSGSGKSSLVRALVGVWQPAR